MSVEVSRVDDCYQIRIPVKESYDDPNVRKFLDYLRIKKLKENSQATDENIDNLSQEVMSDWMKGSGKNFLK